MNISDFRKIRRAETILLKESRPLKVQWFRLKSGIVINMIHYNRPDLFVPDKRETALSRVRKAFTTFYIVRVKTMRKYQIIPNKLGHVFSYGVQVISYTMGLDND
jgi:hypothetical protein